MSRQLYFECASGISGDMTVAALLDLGADEQVLRKTLGTLPIEGTLRDTYQQSEKIQSGRL